MRRFAGTHHRTSERGTVLLMATVTILIVVGMLALAVDVGYLMNGRGQLQNALDASALAAAQGLRVAIEPAGVKAEQVKIVRNLAKDFALFNPMRRADGTNGLTLADSDIEIQEGANPGQPARVIVKHRLAFPTIFGNVFGISSMNISAVAIASTTVVDGGTGFVSGCWRPILIPDTFFDKYDRVWAICDPDAQIQGGLKPCRPINEIDPSTPSSHPLRTYPYLALQDQDYYVSRFASLEAESLRGSNPDFQFMQERLDLQIIPNQASHIQVTSMRDAWHEGELKSNGGRNLIGIQMRLRQQDWRLIDFAKSGVAGNFPANPAQQINKGCCAPIRIGQRVAVYPDPLDKDAGIYQNFAQALKMYYDTNFNEGGTTTSTGFQYKYAQTSKFPTPNANPRVIPVLLCSPLQFSNTLTGNDQFYITNVGAFYLTNVDSSGAFVGYFVREVMTGGMPLQPENAVANTSFLPVSVNLVR
jgi:hypothetical protein